MPTQQEILDQIDVRFAAQAKKITQAQQRFFDERGRYAQGLRTHSVVPKDSMETVADRLNSHPTDQAESWRALAQQYGLTIPASQMAAVTVDIYDGPQGHGYVVHLDVEIAGRQWRRSINIGPEMWRTIAWTDLTPAAL